MKYKKKYFLILILILSFFIFTNIVLAQGGVIPSPSGGSGAGDYTLNDFVLTGVLISDFILGIVGSLSLLMFVVGGVLFMISAGSSEKIAQAKRILIASVVGLLIVFSSFLIIKFTIDSIDAKDSFDGKVNVSIVSPLDLRYL